jgi:proteasome lid subunit RPN8/RPN11
VFASDPRTDTVVRFFPLTNVARSAQIYQIDGGEYLAAEKAADESGLMVSGVMHSHTHTTNYPSPTDIADAANFDPFGAWHFVIVSLKHPEASMRSFRIVDGIVTEEPIQFRSE